MVVFGEVEKYLSVLAADLLAQKLLDRAAASHTQTILAGNTSRCEFKHEDASTEKRSRCLRLWSFLKPVPFLLLFLPQSVPEKCRDQSRASDQDKWIQRVAGAFVLVSSAVH